MRRNGPNLFDMRLDVSCMQPRDGWMDDEEENFGSERDFGKAGQTDRQTEGR